MKKNNTPKNGNRCGETERNFVSICAVALIFIIAQAGVFSESRASDVVTATIRKAENGTLDGSELKASYAGLYRSAEEINQIYVVVVTNLQNRIKFIRIQNMQYQGRITGLRKESEKLRAEFERICKKEKAVSCKLNAAQNEFKGAREEMTSKIDALNSEIKRMNGELRVRESAISLLMKDLEKRTTARDLLSKENAETKTDLAECRGLIDGLKARNADLSNRLFRERDKTAGLELEKSGIAGNMKGYKDLAARLEKDKKSLSDALVGEVNRAAELARQNNALEENLKGFRDQVGKLEKDNANLSVDLVQQKNKAAELLRQNQSSAEELKKSRTAIDDLKDRNSELADKFSAESDKTAELSELNQRTLEELKKYKDMADELRGRNLELSNNLVTEQNKADQVAKKLDESKSTYDNLISELQQEIENGKVTVNRIKDRLTVNLIDKILFNSGSIVINDEGLIVLKKIANVLVKINNRRIQIEGHTDNIPITSSLKEKFPTNWELASLRAVTVVRYLTEACGLNPEYISAAGYSEYKPVDSNETPGGRYNNRRIEIILTPLERVVEQLQ